MNIEDTQKLIGWCRYFPLKKGGRYYDIETFAHSRKRSKEIYSDMVRHIREPERNKILKDATYCKVSVTITPLTN